MKADFSRKLRNFSDLYAAMYPGKSSKDVTFIVTHDCNLRCSYCYEHHKGAGKMTLETAKKCVDMLFREDARNSAYLNPIDANGLILNFIGGEPLLEIELMDAVLDYFREQAMARHHRWATQYTVSVSTNGMEYFDPAVQSFLRKNEGRVSMGVTLDGDKQTHDSCRVDCAGCGSYDKASAAFQHIYREHGQDGTKFTIAPGNVERTFNACKDMIERYDLKSLYCNCVYEEGWELSHAKVLYEELKKLADWLLDTGREDMFLSIFDPFIGKAQTEHDTQNWCGGTGKMLAFDIDGTVLPCMRYSPLSIGEKQPLLRIGDCEHGIGVLEEDAQRVALLNSVTRQSQSTPECLRCPICTGCGWCSAYNYEVFGTPNQRATFICPMHKARVLAAGYYHNSRLLRTGKGEPFPMNVPRDWGEELVGKSEYELLVQLGGKVLD